MHDRMVFLAIPAARDMMAAVRVSAVRVSAVRVSAVRVSAVRVSVVRVSAVRVLIVSVPVLHVPVSTSSTCQSHSFVIAEPVSVVRIVTDPGQLMIRL